MNKRTKQIMTLLCLSFLMKSTAGYAQKTKSALFMNADQAILYAQQVQADILVPVTYAEGVDRYEDAEKSFSNNKNMDKIEASLSEAVNYFNRAVDFSVSARIVFANTLDAREDALSAGANVYAKELWQEAEQAFYQAAKELENGNKDNSYNYSKEAMDTYRQAELAAIKTDLLDETRALLEKADDLKVDRNAPKTLQKATALLAETEKKLETNRYDMDYPRILAKEARYEAKHAIYLNSAIDKIDDNDLDMEDVILQYESPLTRIAERIGFVAQFDEGVEKPENKIIQYVVDLQNKNANLLAGNIANDYKIRTLESTIAVLEKENEALNIELKNESIQRTEVMIAQMKAFENEKTILIAKIEKQRELDNQFEEAYMIFNSTEASVLRSENTVILRMHGFNFDVGKSDIKPENFALLTKVQNAINLFPGSAVIVEGYTDSFGGDASNVILSQHRSDAVTQYLTANSDTPGSHSITSVGYGEINPVANNETTEGRRQNRRIDIIIQPGL